MEQPNESFYDVVADPDIPLEVLLKKTTEMLLGRALDCGRMSIQYPEAEKQFSRSLKSYANELLRQAISELRKAKFTPIPSADRQRFLLEGMRKKKEEGR
jgi:hypothetical protein